MPSNHLGIALAVALPAGERDNALVVLTLHRGEQLADPWVYRDVALLAGLRRFLATRSDVERSIDANARLLPREANVPPTEVEERLRSKSCERRDGVDLSVRDGNVGTRDERQERVGFEDCRSRSSSSMSSADTGGLRPIVGFSLTGPTCTSP
jgi:hypothetical protein